ncbi:prephenate dehydrogenase [Nocardioides sp. ChNu-153]|uniref:prephenate dehydrogenase n=1 Tax=unclassified Nocardioides TaxID=2615069 RepID=UPI002406B2DF|nr:MULTISPECIES: prephenate dehydrogenase [unclassified Nocardioides]MDF9715224.1 prephenate dehydrogenase [Nocardioides sp. ChNu-99]MDN7122565.1 prephenate dehydrogenase [Nocardioides sp. ChNu-153]
MSEAPPDLPPPGTAAAPGTVLVVGAGLIGTSVALALTAAGHDVLVADAQPENVRTATQLGAGLDAATVPDPDVALVVVAVPPDALGAVVTDRLLRHPRAVVTDVGSIKDQPLREVLAGPAAGEVARYVGSHPMAGSERSGPLAASSTLFEGRPWAITPHPDAPRSAVELVEAVVRTCGAVVVWLTPAEHDRAVARTSHVPHLLSALVAGRLAEAPEQHLALAGQGVRDVTRVAAGDPALYGQIVAGNADAVLDLLTEVRAELDRVIAAVGEGDRHQLGAVLERGVAGTRAIPAKHGGPPRPLRSVWVSVPDAPGALARLFADAVASGVNIEDIRIDHDPGRPTGLVELVVDATRAEHLLASLEERAWVTHR